MHILVVDIGGSHVKLRATTADAPRRFDSDETLTPEALVTRVLHATTDWSFDVVSLGYPGQVGADGPAREPGNLGAGWVGFDFRAAFSKPVRIVNDAVLQALGAYQGKRMLFLGLGTGLGSALVTERVVVPLELGELPYGGGTIADHVGRAALERSGPRRWQDVVHEVTDVLRRALVADYVVLGGGNADRVNPLPAYTHQGGNDDAFEGGTRLWRELVEPHDREPSPFWRVVT